MSDSDSVLTDTVEFDELVDSLTDEQREVLAALSQEELNALSNEELADLILGPSDEDWDDEDWDDENSATVRAKWSIDDAKTLSEAAAMSRAFAEWLENLERDGWQLTGPVEDDYGFIRREPAVASSETSS
jgi:hypothetical protein